MSLSWWLRHKIVIEVELEHRVNFLVLDLNRGLWVYCGLVLLVLHIQFVPLRCTLVLLSSLISTYLSLHHNLPFFFWGAFEFIDLNEHVVRFLSLYFRRCRSIFLLDWEYLFEMWFLMLLRSLIMISPLLELLLKFEILLNVALDWSHEEIWLLVLCSCISSWCYFDLGLRLSVRTNWSVSLLNGILECSVPFLWWNFSSICLVVLRIQDWKLKFLSLVMVLIKGLLNFQTDSSRLLGCRVRDKFRNLRERLILLVVFIRRNLNKWALSWTNRPWLRYYLWLARVIVEIV